MTVNHFIKNVEHCTCIKIQWLMTIVFLHVLWWKNHHWNVQFQKKPVSTQRLCTVATKKACLNAAFGRSNWTKQCSIKATPMRHFTHDPPSTDMQSMRICRPPRRTQGQHFRFQGFKKVRLQDPCGHSPKMMPWWGPGDIKCCLCQWAGQLWCTRARVTDLKAAQFSFSS